MKQLGMGALGWPPDAFWQANVSDLMAALEGLNELNGGGTDDVEPMTKADVLALVELYPNRE